MLEKLRGRFWKLSPAVLIAGGVLAFAVVAGTAMLLSRRDSKAEAAIEPVAARIDQINGSVGIARVNADDQQLDWAEATVNMPVTVGDRIYARDSAQASIALTGRNSVRLNPETTLDVLTLTEHRTQLALRGGSGLFDVGALTADDFFEVATPCGAVDLREPGLYQIGMDGDNAIISVLSGSAQVVGLGGSGYITKGQVYTLYGQDSSEAAVATLAPDTAGEIVDTYYRERYPRIYDGRYRSYDAYLADPFFYDPYRTSLSYRYLPVDVPGLYDLDYYGDWVDVASYGYCWAPRVSSGWAPFRSGYWDFDDLWGPSWISSEPWGWAPYHYGRWAFISQRWYWVPSEIRVRRAYCPATVAFIPVQDRIAWVPLGPGELYVQRYYDLDLRPRFLATTAVVNVASVQTTFVNFNAPGGVTVVPIRTLTRVIDPSVIETVDLRAIKGTHRVLDPFSIGGVRDLALRREDGRRRLRLERIGREGVSRPVITGLAPEAMRGRSDIAKALRVEPVPGNRRKSKLEFSNAGTVNSIRDNGLPEPKSADSRRMNELGARAERGDQSARRELRQMMRENERAKGPKLKPQSGAHPPESAHQPNLSRKELRLQRKAERKQPAQLMTGGERRDQAAKQNTVRRQVQRQPASPRRVDRPQPVPRPQTRPQTKAQPRPKRKPPDTAAKRQQLTRSGGFGARAAARRPQPPIAARGHLRPGQSAASRQSPRPLEPRQQAILQRQKTGGDSVSRSPIAPAGPRSLDQKVRRSQAPGKMPNGPRKHPR